MYFISGFCSSPGECNSKTKIMILLKTVSGPSKNWFKTGFIFLPFSLPLFTLGGRKRGRNDNSCGKFIDTEILIILSSM